MFGTEQPEHSCCLRPLGQVSTTGHSSSWLPCDKLGGDPELQACTQPEGVHRNALALTVASWPSLGFSQDLTPSRVRLTPTRPSFPRRLISWSGLTTKLWNEKRQLC